MVHVKKCHPGQFEALGNGTKTFEWRKEDDCTFEVDDLLLLLEYEPEERYTRPKIDRFGWHTGEEEYVSRKAGYTGSVLKRRVTYVLRGEFGVPEGYAVLGLAIP